MSLVMRKPVFALCSNKGADQSGGERGGSVVECRTPQREVRGSKPTAAVLCPWARHFTPRKYWLITQEAMAPSRHDWKIVDWDVKPQHNQRSVWAAPSEFGTYRLCEQRRFRRACASAQSRQNLRCSLIQAVSQEEPSDRKPYPWPLWMAGHAQLKFVMTECSKTQIRLSGLSLIETFVVGLLDSIVLVLAISEISRR